MKTINLHIYPSSFQYESRILKETKSISEMGIVDKVVVVASQRNGLPEHEQIDGCRQLVRIETFFDVDSRSLVIRTLRFIEWQVRVFLRFKAEGVQFINCHSISVLPVGVLFKKACKVKLIYDPHELETETGGSVGIRKRIAKYMERILIKSVDSTITVNESIAEWYRRSYSLDRVFVVKNVPYYRKWEKIETINLKKRFGIPSDHLLYVYQGVLGNGRGITLLLDVFVKMDASKHLLFIGYGEFEGLIKLHAGKFPNIHFHEAVPPSEVHKYTSACDVGLCLIENTCLSYYLSLPNKLYEYTMSGVPTLASDFPEIRAVLEGSRSGWVVSVEENAIRKLIERIDSTEIQRKRQGVMKFREGIGWHQEEQVLQGVYRFLSAPVSTRE